MPSVPIEPAVKEQILSLSSKGLSEKEIASQLGIRTIGVFGVLNGDRVKRGLVEAFGGKRGVRKPKDATATALHAASKATAAAAAIVEAKSSGIEKSSSPSVVYDVPLFPASGAHEVEKLQIIRHVSNPPGSAATGYLGTLPPDSDEGDIEASWGGGTYDVRAVNSRGKQIDRKTVKLGASSKRAVPEPMPDGLYPVSPDFMHNPVISQLIDSQKESQRRFDAFMTAQADKEARAMEERMKERSALESDRVKQSQDFFSAMMSMQNQSSQQMMAMLQQTSQQTMQVFQAMSAGKSSTKEVLEMVKVVKELSGDGADDDAMTELAKAVPSVTKDLKDIFIARGLSHPSSSGTTSAQGRNINQMAKELHDHLISIGWPPERAKKHLETVLKYTVEEHQKVAAEIQKTAPKKEIPPTTNGSQPPPGTKDEKDKKEEE